MTLNPNVNVDTSNASFDKFTPADGYELWRDNEEGNLDENGQPLSYMKSIYAPKAVSESFAPHIWAKLIGEFDIITFFTRKVNIFLKNHYNLIQNSVFSLCLYYISDLMLKKLKNEGLKAISVKNSLDTAAIIEYNENN